MEYNFDKETNRLNTNNYKWDKLFERYGKKDILPFWIADMEFETAPEVVKSLLHRTGHGIFGYSFKPDGYYSAFQSWTRLRHGWEVKRDWITSSPGVMAGLSILIDCLTKQGDRIVILSPAYTGFYEKIHQNGRKAAESRLRLEAGRYTIDYEDFEKVISENAGGLFLFCNPHNPSGRVWQEQELRTLLAICQRWDMTVISDDIHCDIVYSGSRYIPLSSLAGDYEERIITCTAPGKTFNLTGTATSIIVIPSPRMRAAFNRELNRLELSDGNLFGNLAAEAAYGKGGPWADALTVYLEENRDFMLRFLRESKIPMEAVKPEGTYMMLLDGSSIGPDEVTIKNRLIYEAKILLNQGSSFGEAARGQVRFNFACQRAMLKEGLNRLAKLF